MAPDFVVEGTHRLALQIQVEIHVKFAIAPGIAPDRCRRRFRPTAGVAEKVGHMRLIEPDQPVEASRLRCRCRIGCRLDRALLGNRRPLADGPWRQIREHRGV
jgi:hypothetical protein